MIKKFKLPKNWRTQLIIEEYRYSRKELEYRLKLKDKDIGYLSVLKKGKYFFVKVVSVIPEMRGKGCGSMLYEHAINQLGKLSTNYHAASSLAQRVWIRLIKKYEHTDEFFTGILTVYKKKD